MHNVSAIAIAPTNTNRKQLYAESKKTAEKRVFYHAIDVYLKDSNAYQNTYFARYFEWQGICRERWFHSCISADMLNAEGEFITKSAHQNYLRSTFPFQTVNCYLTTFNVRKCAFSLWFEFFAQGELVSTGYQEIVFASDKKIARLPDALIEKIKQYDHGRTHYE